MSLDDEMWSREGSKLFNLPAIIARECKWWQRLCCTLFGHQWHSRGHFCWRCGVRP